MRYAALLDLRIGHHRLDGAGPHEFVPALFLAGRERFQRQGMADGEQHHENEGGACNRF
jgi:hypothetical protein